MHILELLFLVRYFAYSFSELLQADAALEISVRLTLHLELQSLLSPELKNQFTAECLRRRSKCRRSQVTSIHYEKVPLDRHCNRSCVCLVVPRLHVAMIQITEVCTFKPNSTLLVIFEIRLSHPSCDRAKLALA